MSRSVSSKPIPESNPGLFGSGYADLGIRNALCWGIEGFETPNYVQEAGRGSGYVPALLE